MTDKRNEAKTVYKLKQNKPAFEVVDGPLAGHKYTHGLAYSEIPPGDKNKFETATGPVGAGLVPARSTTKKKGDKK